MYYFVDSNGQQQGPVAANDLPRYGVTPHTNVWKQGMSAWQLAGSVGELAWIFSPQPPQPAPLMPPPAYAANDETSNGITFLNVLEYLCYAFAAIDFAGMFFEYDLTGVPWSPVAACCIGYAFHAWDKENKKTKN